MNPYELTRNLRAYAHAAEVADLVAKRDAGDRAVAVRTDIDPSRYKPLVAGVRDTVVGNDPDQFMSPHQPLEPQQSQIKGRQFDYPVGINLQWTPRGTETTTFNQLRTLADTYDLLRIVIETRKDQLTRYEWDIVPRDRSKKPDARCDAVEKFLKRPDRVNNWQTWLRAVAEDLLVTDAVAIYPRLTRGGGLYSLDLMDGTTLKVVIDESGRRPEPPGVAYQQVIKGIPAVDYSADELIYAPRNVRTNRLYGYGPVEQIVMTVNIALRRQLSQLQAYTEGNVPEAIASVPASWGAKQIAEFQQYWDTLLEGNTAMRRHMKFVPDGMKYYPTIQEMLKDPFDEWLARVICFAFSIPPSAFTREMNRATASSAKESSLEEGLMPVMMWVRDLMDLIVERYFGFEDLCFAWKDDEPSDPMLAAQIDGMRLSTGVKSVDEIRQRIGLVPIGMPNAVQGTVTLVKDILNPPEPPALPGAPGGANAKGNPAAGTGGKPPGIGAIGGGKDRARGQDGRERSQPTTPGEGAAKGEGVHVHLTMPPMRPPDVLVENHIHTAE